MQIEIKDLQIGDEILAPLNGTFMYIRILREPKLSKKLTWAGNPRYVAIRGTTRTEKKTYTRTYSQGNGTYSWDKIIYHLTPDGHNVEKAFNLNERPLWLVKGEPR